MNESDIREKIRDYIAKIGLKPTKLYLGAKEWEEFRFINRYVDFEYKMDNSSLPYMGLEIYIVTKDSHFNVT